MEYVVFVGGIIGCLVMLKVLAWPIKKILKVVLNIIIGVTMLFLFNLLGAKLFNFILPVNWITALMTGILGIPGFFCIVIYCLIF